MLDVKRFVWSILHIILSHLCDNCQVLLSYGCLSLFLLPSGTVGYAVSASNISNINMKPLICHMQLRNLVWSTSKHDVYLVSHYSIVHWSSLHSKRSEVLNVSGHVAPCEVIIFAVLCC